MKGRGGKRAALALVLLAPAAVAQNASIARASVAPAPIPATRIPQLMLKNLETIFDSRLAALDPKDPIDMLGTTRGLYVPGFGTVFTTEISLIVSPGLFPVAGPRYTPELRAQVHQRKAAQIPKLQETMKDMVKVTALTLVPMPDDQRIVLAVRLRYLSEEDTAGLPAQIVMTADKKSAQLGDIKTEIE
jgi:hypothetical protein